MPKLDEIKTRRERITQGGWVFEKQPSIHFDCPNLKHIAICGYVKKEFSSNEITDFIANAPTDIDWLIDAYETAVFELLRQADSVCYMEDGSFRTSAVTHQAEILHALEKLGLFEITGFGSYRYVWGNLTPKGEEMMKRAREVQYDF